MKAWPMKPLHEIADVEGGSTPRRDVPEYWNGNIPWATPTDLSVPGAGIANISRTKDLITDKGLASCSAKYLPVGTVLYSSRATIGKIAVAAVPLTTNQGFANLIPHEGIDSRFLAYSLWYFTPQIETLAGSTTFREVSRGNFRRFKIPVPPLDEQQRIVRILDEAETLRQLRARADERMADFIPALFNQMFGPFAVKHSDWAYANLTELCVHSDDIRCGPFGTQLQRHEYRSNGIPLWSIAHVNSHFSIPTNDSLTPEKALALENYSLLPGDIVMTRKATVGNCTVYPATLPKGIMHSDLLRIRLNTARCLPDFLASALAFSQEVKAQIDMVTSGATTQGINVTRLKNISIHVPPLALQRDFAARVAEARAVQDQQACSRSRLEAGFQALLHRAFGGEL